MCLILYHSLLQTKLKNQWICDRMKDKVTITIEVKECRKVGILIANHPNNRRKIHPRQDKEKGFNDMRTYRAEEEAKGC